MQTVGQFYREAKNSLQHYLGAKEKRPKDTLESDFEGKVDAYADKSFCSSHWKASLAMAGKGAVVLLGVTGVSGAALRVLKQNPKVVDKPLQSENTFTLGRSLLSINDGLSVNNRIPDQVAIPGTPFYLFAPDTFNYAGNGTLSLTATLDDGNNLPGWLGFLPMLGSYDTPENAYEVSVQGGFAYIADGASGLQIIDVSTSSNPTLVGTYNTPEDARGVTVVGNLAYVADGGSGLQILDISNPISPFFVGSYDTSGFAYAVAVLTNLAYIADGDSGLQIIDVSNPSSPFLVGAYDTPGNAFDVDVGGNLAFIADQGFGLQIIDASIPSSPSLTGNYDTPNFSWGVSVVGNLAYVADRISGLQIIDISSPSSPTLAGTYDTPGDARGVTVVGNLAYVADLLSGLQVIDISVPSNPALVGTYNTPGSANRVSVLGDLAYVADDEQGVHIIDTFTHSWGRFDGVPQGGNVGAIRIRLTALDSFGKSAYDVFDLFVSNPPFLLSAIPDQSIEFDKAFSLIVDTTIAFGDTDPQTLSFSAMRNDETVLPPWLSLKNFPLSIGSYDISGSASAVTVVGNLAYVGGGVSGFHIIDVSVPNSPSLISTYPTSNAGKVTIIENLAYVSGGNFGLYIIDVSLPSTPSLVSSYNTPDFTRGKSVLGGFTYLADSASGLLIMDISTPSSPVLAGSYDTQGSAFDVCVVGNLAYVADNTSGLLIIDVSNPSSPLLLGSYDTAGNAWGVIIREDFAYVADGGQGLQIIDISDPSFPNFVGSYDSVSFVRTVSIVGNLAYLADEDGLLIIDISTPSNPRLVGSYDTPDLAFGVDVAGDLAYVADWTSGLQIFYVGQWRLFGTPAYDDAETLEIALTASDPAKLSVTDTFKLRVEAPPQFANPINDQATQIDVPFTFFIDQATFTDPNGDAIFYSAVQNGTSALPPWLSFSPGGIFAGTPRTSDADLYVIEVNAFDGIVADSASTTFNLNVDHRPSAIQSIPNQQAVIGRPFSFTFDQNSFQDLDGDELTFSMEGENGPLPSWLSFDAQTLTFSGTPQAADDGEVSIIATASDGQSEAQSRFRITVSANLAPQVANPISNQAVTVGQKFSFIVPETTFKDMNGDSLTYAANHLPNWLSFDEISRTLSGKPDRSHTGSFDDKSYPIEIVASDGTSSVSTIFNIAVQGTSNVELGLVIAGPLASIAALSLAWFKKRGLVLNPLNKPKYQKPKESIEVRQTSYSRKLNVPLNEVKLVQAFKGKRVIGGLRVPKRFENALSHDRSLPGGLLLPNWLQYDSGENELCLSKSIKESDAGTYLIRVYSHGDVIKEEFELVVGGDVEMQALVTR